jgi:hypothetical protein
MWKTGRELALPHLGVLRAMLQVRVFRQQSDAFLDRSARRGRRVQHGYGQRTILDDDLSASSHLGQQRGEVARGLGCRDMDRMIIPLFLSWCWSDLVL